MPGGLPDKVATRTTPHGGERSRHSNTRETLPQKIYGSTEVHFAPLLRFSGLIYSSVWTIYLPTSVAMDSDIVPRRIGMAVSSDVLCF